jgi:protein-tyrosine phosphatase
MYYDLHAHILPNVDDGPKEMEDAILMAQVAAKDGTRAILATPHRKDVTEKFSVAHIKDLVNCINSILRETEINLQLFLGMENHLDLELPRDFSNGQALTINDTKYALVEMPFFGHPNYLEEILFQIQLQGIIPILAHPERIEAVQLNPSLLVNFVERGMLSQVTAGSVVGHFGVKVKKLTIKLLKMGLVHILASDTHFPAGPRSPILTEGLAVASSVIGQKKALAMLTTTPKAVLEGNPVVLPPIQIDLPEQHWWKIWNR